MKILYFGTYDPDYSRNAILIDGLKRNHVEVIQCRETSTGIIKFIRLFRKHWEIRNTYDVMVIGFLGHTIVPFARIITKKPIIFDAFVSIYDSNVNDRKLVKPRGLGAKYYWFLDWMSMSLANIVLFDTNQQIDYVVGEFKLNKKKFKRIFVGAKTEMFLPVSNQSKHDQFTVFFYGSFIPLQGIEYILKSAKIITDPEVRFVIAGDGQEKKKMLILANKLELSNVTFVDFLELEALKRQLAEADICLGIFGNSSKAQRVIPNKVYDALAIRKPVITSDTPALRELFSADDVYFTKTADPDSLATAIMTLKQDKDLCGNLAMNGFNKISSQATPSILGKQLLEISKELI